MKIELYYFEGCPTYQQTRINLEKALNQLGIEADIAMILVESPEHAEQLRFQGSPSICIDGNDMDRKDEPALFGCRIYQIDGKLTGVPTIDYIENRIRQNFR